MKPEGSGKWEKINAQCSEAAEQQTHFRILTDLVKQQTKVVGRKISYKIKP